jgi:hypothetical protein
MPRVRQRDALVENNLKLRSGKGMMDAETVVILCVWWTPDDYKGFNGVWYG